MRLRLRHDLPFTMIGFEHEGRSLRVEPVLVDTGSASSVFSADRLADLGILPRPEDRLRTLRGIGGTEVVFTRTIDRLVVDGAELANFEIEVGAMDYGFEIEGILGMNFLRQVGAVLDLGQMKMQVES